MTCLSFSEITALCTKAARGAGYSWGMSQEAGFAARWLCRNGLPGCGIVLNLLQQVDGRVDHPYTPQIHEGRVSGAGGPTCGLSLGCALSDLPPVQEELSFSQVMASPILLPFVANIGEPDTVTQLRWEGVHAWVGGGKLMKLEGHALMNDREDVTIRLADALDYSQEPSPTRQIDGKHRAGLEGFAARTYVPESELSRAKGAGGV